MLSALLPLVRSRTDLPRRLLSQISANRSRRALLRLDDHLLRDIGLTRGEAEAEALRGAWDAPSHWKA